jgi:hypothetical protein
MCKRRFERLDPDDDGPSPCGAAGLWCTGNAKWLFGNQRLCSACKTVAEEARLDAQPGDREELP